MTTSERCQKVQQEIKNGTAGVFLIDKVDLFDERNGSSPIRFEGLVKASFRTRSNKYSTSHEKGKIQRRESQKRKPARPK